MKISSIGSLTKWTAYCLSNDKDLWQSFPSMCSSLSCKLIFTDVSSLSVMLDFFPHSRNLKKVERKCLEHETCDFEQFFIWRKLSCFLILHKFLFFPPNSSVLYYYLLIANLQQEFKQIRKGWQIPRRKMQVWLHFNCYVMAFDLERWKTTLIEPVFHSGSRIPTLSMY